MYEMLCCLFLDCPAHKFKQEDDDTDDDTNDKEVHSDGKSPDILSEAYDLPVDSDDSDKSLAIETESQLEEESQEGPMANPESAASGKDMSMDLDPDVSLQMSVPETAQEV